MFSRISLQNEREEVERQKEYFSKLRADFQPDGQKVKVIALTQEPSNMNTIKITLHVQNDKMSIFWWFPVYFGKRNHSTWKMRHLTYMCRTVACPWHICKWEVYWLLKGVWHVNGWCVGSRLKVYQKMHSESCMASLYTLVSIRKLFAWKVKALLIPGGKMWTPEYLAAPIVTCIVLPLDVDSSSFDHHTWQPKLSQMGAQTDMTFFLASTVQSATKFYIFTLHQLSVC